MPDALKLTIEPTDKLVNIRQSLTGVVTPCRIWQGEDETGQQVHLYVLRVALPDAAPLDAHARFAEALLPTSPMRADVEALPLRLVL